MSKNSIKILGLSFFYHDSAAALIIDGKVIAAVQEERFTRVKHDDSFPKQAIDFCLHYANINIEEIDYMVFYEKPILKFERILRMYIKSWPKSIFAFVKALTAWLTKKLWVEHTIRKTLNYKGKILFTEHHYAHAASTYFCSDFDEAAIITIDGVGEWDTTTIGYGIGNKLKLTKSINFPHSLGMLYSAITYYLGFKVNSAEYKVMGLAPYGNAEIYLSQFKKLITIRDDGSYELDMRYFAYGYGLKMTNKKLEQLFGYPRRQEETPLMQHHKDIAAALQKITEDAVLKIAAYAKKQFASQNLCLAGGVALNCVANSKILQSGLFKKIYIQPAAGDAGGAIGAALYVFYALLTLRSHHDSMPNAFLGSEYNNAEIKKFLDTGVKKFINKQGIIYREVDDQRLISEIAERLKKNQIIGWFQNRMEFGPRALGARSILADARILDNWQRVNMKIKFRESFRPFAPAVLQEEAENYFDLKVPSPYMLLTAKVKRSNIPAITHVDGSARIQTINETNDRFYKLLKEFYRQTGCPVIINTSFNIRGAPIVESPRDAFECFIYTQMDCLAIGNFIITKKANSKSGAGKEQLQSYLKRFNMD